MFKKAVFPGKYIQGAGAITELPALVGLLGQRGLIVASPSVRDRVLPQSGLDLKKASLRVETFCGECCEGEVARISEIVARENVNVLIGMGGGKVIDTAKIVADRANIPVIVVPTIASTDAPCSGCAVLYSRDGVFEKVYYQKLNPAAVLVDVNIISAAPTRYLVSGMGDALATWFEARSCERTQSPNECGGVGTAVGQAISKLCYETLLSHGAAAKVANDLHVVTPALERIVEANILLSGVGFESAGLGAAHSIHNGLTALAETHVFFHGEKVAFGLLAGLVLTDAPADETEAVFSFCEEIGLPTTLADLGVKEITREHLASAAEMACEPGQYIHHEAGEITSEMVLSAMIAADALGSSRKLRRNCF
jgi:glycerol dehydrogenase